MLAITKPTTSIALAGLLFLACDKNGTGPETSGTFALTSPTLQPDGVIPQRHWLNAFGCTGDNIRPALSWKNAPAGTKSFALTVFDHDAPTGSGFWHWMAYDIPSGIAGTPEGTVAGNLPAGTVEGNTDLGTPGWFGACPTDGRLHHYTYTVYALDTDKVAVPSGATAAFTSFVMLQRVLGKAALNVTAGGTNTTPPTTPAAFTVTSPTLQDGGAIPQRHWFNTFGCTGDNIRPALNWSGAPAGTKSFALTVFDNDAPTGSGFWHWVAYNVPATTTGLPEGTVAGNLPAGTVEGNTDLGAPGWFGACPTDGLQHRYTYSVYALGTDNLALPAGSTAAFAAFNIMGNVIGKAALNVTAKK